MKRHISTAMLITFIFTITAPTINFSAENRTVKISQPRAEAFLTKKMEELVDKTIEGIEKTIHDSAKKINDKLSKKSNKPKNKNKNKPKSKSKSKAKDTSKVKPAFNVDFNELESLRKNVVINLGKATAFTAASEFKLQEVSGMTDIGNHAEKGEIANSLQNKPDDMNKNYRFAELNSFVNEAGPNQIMTVLDEKNRQQDANVKQHLIWAKIDRAKAKIHNEAAMKEADDLAKQAKKLMEKSKTDDINWDKLRVIKTIADDALKLGKALELRNKAIDDVTKKYEKANDITDPTK